MMKTHFSPMPHLLPVSELPICQRDLCSSINSQMKVVLGLKLQATYKIWTCKSIVRFRLWTLVCLLSLEWVIQKLVFNRTASIRTSSFQTRHTMLPSPHPQTPLVLLLFGHQLGYRKRAQYRLSRSQKPLVYALCPRLHLPRQRKSRGRLLFYPQRSGGTMKKLLAIILMIPPMMATVSTALAFYLRQQ